jgi:chromosome segregation ATPase
MWKKIYEALSRLFALTQKVERHDKEIAELRQELRNLTAMVQRLAYETQRVSEREGHEREKMVLRLENQLLRFERRLPPAGRSESNEDQD